MADLTLSSNAATLAGSLSRAGEDLVGGLDEVNAEAGRVVLAATRPPRRTGALAAGLRSVVDSQGATLASTVPYWTFVHWGAPRRHVKAQPFILAALQASRSEVLDLYLTYARRVVGNIDS